MPALSRAASDVEQDRPRSPRRRRWLAVPFGVAALLLAHTPTLRGSGADGLASGLLGVVGTYLPLLAVVAGGLLCCDWWISERQDSARAATVLLTIGLATPSSQLAAVESDSPLGWAVTPTLADVLTSALLGIALLALVHRVVFHHRIQPVVVSLGLAVGFGTVTAVAAAGWLGAWAAEPVPALPGGPLGTAVVLLAAVKIVGATVASAHQLHDLPRWARRELQVAAALLAASWLLIHLGTGEAVRAALGVISLAAMVLVVTTAAVLTAIGLRDHSRTRRTLSDRAVTAEARLRHDEELLHEMRSTVAGINATTQILYQPDHEVAAVHQERLQTLLVHEIDRLNQMVGGHGERPRLLDVDAVLEPVISSFRYQGLEIDWRPGRATAFAGPAAVAQLVQVLLHNASKHAAGSAVRVATTVADGVAEIEVSDDGPGIPADRREQVFKRGVRGATSGGEGLGLHIARRLAAQQGGSLTLDPEITDGASFRIRLPLADG